MLNLNTIDYIAAILQDSYIAHIWKPNVIDSPAINSNLSQSLLALLAAILARITPNVAPVFEIASGLSKNINQCAMAHADTTSKTKLKYNVNPKIRNELFFERLNFAPPI
ncbi:hypothetical protein EGH82_08705 [Vibrio ponticus]|uniref:Uncharacterized protein n=1 Tax=Vibrio ponticus TaxID=265668 RepID=A0A3N3E1V3_9VIBR|nr:hypothetical protein EGH82_08705 [Vibrio ponticus]